jgi:hypothetical protein
MMIGALYGALRIHQSPGSVGDESASQPGHAAARIWLWY